jgi:hypothetical protein
VWVKNEIHDMRENIFISRTDNVVGNAQKPTIRACSTRNFLINTSVFFETMYQDKFVLVKKFTYFMPNSKDVIQEI